MKPIIKVASDASANVAEIISFGMSSEYTWEFDELSFHLSAAATAANSLVVRKRSKYGSAYDVVILTQAMVTVADVFFQPDRPIKMNGRDRLAITWTNDAGADAKIWGLQVNCKA